MNLYLDDYHSDQMDISSTSWFPKITDCWHHQDETYSNYAYIFIVARDIFPIIPHGVGVEASVSFGCHGFGCRQSQTTGKTLCEEVVERQIARANNTILDGAVRLLDTSKKENDREMNQEAEEKKFHSTPKVHDILEMWQGSQNIPAAQRETRAQNGEKTARGYISDTKTIVNASWSLWQHDGAAAFKLSETSLLPPPLSAKNYPAGWTQIVNDRRISWINSQPVESDEDEASESISDTEDWFNWIGDSNNPNDCKDKSTADVESVIAQENRIEYLEWPEQHDVSAAPNVPGLIRPTWKSHGQVEKLLMTVNAIETRRNEDVHQK